MALKYLSHIETLNIDMQQNVLSNVVIHPLTTATRPATPIVGQTIYNGTLKALEVWDGSAWVSASGDITSITAGTGLSGGGSVGAVTVSIDYIGTGNIILAAGAISGTVSTADFILVSDTTVGNAVKAPVSSLPFTANLGTVTSVAATGAGGIVVAGSPITTSGTLALSLSAVPNASLANSTITINGTAVALGGSINVGDITGVTAGVGLSGGGATGAVTLDLDFSELTDMTADITGATEFILQNGTTESRKAASEIKLSAFNNDQNWSSTVGTVTSISVAGNDGISVSGSPITTSGIITLGITNGSIANAKLANSTITIGTTVIALGAASTSLSGLTSLDFAAGARTIGASIGANALTLGGATSTVVIPGNLTVSGTTTTVNTETILLADNIITLNSNATGAATENAGFEIERGTDLNVSLLWDEAANRWTVGTESFVAGTFIGALNGNAATVTNGVYTTGSYSDPSWITALNWSKITNKPDPVVTVTLTGDVTGSGNTTLTDLASGTISFATTIAANSVALGTDTTGNYVATVAGSNGISVTGSGSENAAVTVTGINASTTAVGVVELATNAEAITGTDATRAVTPQGAASLVNDRIIAERFYIAIGDGSSTSIPVVHNLNSDYVIVQCFEASSGQLVMVDIRKIDPNSMQFDFANPPAPGDILVSMIRVR